ncbi:hypothetical protein pipiens_003631 [Culex pipiens pipiens]|uniref:Uncharacterized protein n=1 Tax=Culex pipiens pipiens TaxID=38569 RepID=A0ABD1CUI7_CULPP
MPRPDISSSPSRIHQRSATVIDVRGTRPDRTARYAAKPERNYRLASRPASVPKVSGSPHQARDAKVDGETPPAAFEARRERTRRQASAVSKDEPDLKRTREAKLESGGGRRDASHAKNHKRLRVTTHTRTTEARFSVKVTPTRKQVVMRTVLEARGTPLEDLKLKRTPPNRTGAFIHRLLCARGPTDCTGRAAAVLSANTIGGDRVEASRRGRRSRAWRKDTEGANVVRKRPNIAHREARVWHASAPARGAQARTYAERVARTRSAWCERDAEAGARADRRGPGRAATAWRQKAREDG